jgi:hypothetical protein
MKFIRRGLYQLVLSSGALIAVSTFAIDAKADPRTHDGFYLHMDLGFGYLSSTASIEGSDASVNYSGVSVPSTLLLGGTVGPVAIGGGFFSDYTPSPSASLDGGSSIELEDVTMYLVGIGMFADIYPNPKEGLHFLPFVGWGGLETSYQGDAGGSDPTGLVMSLGVGYDFWVSNEWSIGVMGRFAYAPLSLNNVDYTTIAPALLATFTYH